MNVGYSCFRAYYRLVKDALKCTTRLESLGMLSLDTPHCDLLDGSAFPNLRQFIISVPSTSSISPFLRSHPKITHLQCYYDIFDSEVPMPALTSYAGHHAMVRQLALSSPSLEILSILWENDDMGELYESTVAALAQGALKVFASTSFGWHPSMVEALARHLPCLAAIAFEDTSPTRLRLLTSDVSRA